jgi:hypothetical protein
MMAITNLSLLFEQRRRTVRARFWGEWNSHSSSE